MYEKLSQACCYRLHAEFTTSNFTFSPSSRSATASSNLIWRFIQNRALLPKYCDKRNAVSALIPLFSLRIWVIRPEGTRNANDNLLAESFRACISRLRIRPGCIGFIISTPMIICYFRAMPNSSSWALSTREGAPVSGQVARRDLGKAITSLMESRPHIIATKRSKPRAIPA